MSYTVKSGDLWECALYLTLGCKLAGIEPVLVNGHVSCQLLIEGENLGILQKQYFAGNYGSPNLRVPPRLRLPPQHSQQIEKEVPERAQEWFD